jgi:hypothetical protein
VLKERLASVSRAEAELASVEQQLEHALKEDDFDMCAKLDAQLAKLRLTLETPAGFHCHVQQPSRELTAAAVLVQMPEENVESGKNYLDTFPNHSFDNYRASNFHQINLDHPGLRLVNEAPYIFLVDLFPGDTCTALMKKAGLNMVKCTMAGPGIDTRHFHTKYHVNVRTSSQLTVPPQEIPGIRAKLQNLLNVPLDQFEDLQVLRYTEGQEFGVHVDTTVPCDQWGRLITVFVYLNSCESGGETVFCGHQRVGCEHLQLNPEVIVKPRQGLAVIHFPVDRSSNIDYMATHGGLPAVSEKFIAVQWVTRGKWPPQHIAATGDDSIL